MKTLLLSLSVLLLPVSWARADEVSPPKPAPSAPVQVPVDPLAVIAAAIDRGAPLFNAGKVAECAALYAEAAQRLLAEPDALTPWDRIDVQQALSAKAADARERAWMLRRAFDGVSANATFEPRMEAALPKGFPKAGPVGRIVEKRYPNYRAARAQGGSSAFWSLFSHIKKNNVEMTAPVEMTMDAEMRMRDMAFLYESPDQGSAGAQGRVDVLDLAPVTVLSLGVRGRRSDALLQRARSLLEQHLAASGWKRDGDFRVLGYNSPMVPAEKQFWELQVPVSR